MGSAGCGVRVATAHADSAGWVAGPAVLAAVDRTGAHTPMLLFKLDNGTTPKLSQAARPATRSLPHGGEVLVGGGVGQGEGAEGGGRQVEEGLTLVHGGAVGACTGGLGNMLQQVGGWHVNAWKVERSAQVSTSGPAHGATGRQLRMKYGSRTRQQQADLCRVAVQLSWCGRLTEEPAGGGGRDALVGHAGAQAVAAVALGKAAAGGGR